MGNNPKRMIAVPFSVFMLRWALFFSSSVISASPSYPYPRNDTLGICFAVREKSLAMYFRLSNFFMESKLLAPKGICNFTFTDVYHSQ